MKANELTLKPAEIEPDTITFCASDKNKITFCGNGDIFINDRLAETDKQVVDGLKDFLVFATMERHKLILKAQLEAIRSVSTYGLKHMIEHYENQLKELDESKK
jgi:hypothetical protein